MSNTARQTLLTAFNQASGRAASGQPSTGDQGLLDALGQASQVVDALTQDTAASTAQQTLATAFNQAPVRAASGQPATGDQSRTDAAGQASQVVQAATQPTGGSTAQQTVVTAFNQAAGNSASGPTSTGGQGLIDALGQATQMVDSLTQATAANTDALAQNSQAKSPSGGGAVSDALGTASQFLGGGLSLMPLASLFASLFGGGQSQQSAPLVPLSLPPSLSLESTTNNQGVVWGENGLPRSAGGGGALSAPTQITVQVQAMDSQSFLDHSDDIAQAVRQAMLNMNSINDVVASL